MASCNYCGDVSYGGHYQDCPRVREYGPTPVPTRPPPDPRDEKLKAAIEALEWYAKMDLVGVRAREALAKVRT